ncbi:MULTISPECIES: hypothetical protein [unclassified Paenibacillus]|uniref:hypothetical protein n=1 Tax=unclassified Paenibacillus TaxID=185978 RepID=UPI00020D7390|nr:MULTISPECIES: hypothetical protein [unclassified Paenibacillus]EGL19522.1 hypothetical protein HMPREF9413_4731 [Paenibacillus sp. HGF7]EPD82503.1 hypothetical protein HMPREF1207_03295 [Paenibacillus sp. HGH0039]
MRRNKWIGLSSGLVILAMAVAGAASLWRPSAELTPEKVVLNWNGRINEVPQADSRYQRLIDDAEKVIESTGKGPCKCTAELTGDVPDKPGLLLMLPPGQSVRIRKEFPVATAVHDVRRLYVPFQDGGDSPRMELDGGVYEVGRESLDALKKTAAEAAGNLTGG